MKLCRKIVVLCYILYSNYETILFRCVTQYLTIYNILQYIKPHLLYVCNTFGNIAINILE